MLTYDAIDADLAFSPAWIRLLSVLLGTPFIRKALADGRMMRQASIGTPRFARMVPRHLFLRCIAAAALCALLFALPLALIMPLLGDGVFTPAGAIGTKVAITIAFSLIIVPLVVIAATVDADRSNRDLSRVPITESKE